MKEDNKNNDKPKNYSKIWGIAGRGFFFIGITFLIFQIIILCFNISVCDDFYCVEMTNLSLSIIPLGLGLFFWFDYRDKALHERRIVEDEEIKMLYSEVEMYGGKNKNTKIARKEIEDLKKTKKYEIDVLPLRKALVNLYPDDDLISKAKEELWLIGEYSTITPSYENLYDEWNDRISDIIKKIENEKEKQDPDTKIIKYNSQKLRAELKSLRERVAWYDQTWAKGEIDIKIVTNWTALSVIVLLIMGILPVIHPVGNNHIMMFNWILLGLSGALLSAVVTIRDLDVNEVGEQEGKQVISQTIVRMSIGALTAILLYVALMGKILSGTIFPILPLESEILRLNPTEFWINTGKSIFWAILSGISIHILTGLVKIGEGTFKKDVE